MWRKLKWLALVPCVFFVALAVFAVVEQRWPGLVKNLLVALFFLSVPFWGKDEVEHSTARDQAP